MSSKTKKGKKKAKVVSDVTRSKDNNKKIYTYFSNEEISEIKSIMKIKDVTGVPFVIAATFLNKFDLLKKLLKEGYNVNQTGQNNMTALMWAVKYKYLDVIDYLLNNGADPTIKTDSGDNILILALEHKLWDEQSLVNLWKSVKKVSFIDVNFTNKNGHNMLHMCVRRDWEQLLKVLLTEKPNIDAGNSNGVTPLMLACFRNNISIINILIDAGADTLKEDNHGRMTLCYAISSSVKINKPPFLATERIIAELRRKCLLETYIKRRLDLILATAKKEEISPATSELLIKILQFAIHFIEEAIGVFLTCQVFKQLLEILEPRMRNSSTAKFLLEVCQEILFYNEQSLGYKPEVYNKILEDFLASRFVEVLLQFIRNESEEAKVASNILVLAFVDNDRWEKILEENCNVILSFLNENQQMSDEIQTKILRMKKRKLKKVFESLEIVPQQEEDKVEDKKSGSSVISKKSKRRSKAMKAKLTKMKSVELTKRLNYGKKPATRPPTEKNDVEFQSKPKEASNPIAASFQHLLDGEDEAVEVKPKEEISPKWKKQIFELVRVNSFGNLPFNREKLACCMNHLKNCEKFDTSVNKSICVVTDYLKQLIAMIVQKFREHWENDRATGTCNCLDPTGKRKGTSGRGRLGARTTGRKTNLTQKK